MYSLGEVIGPFLGGIFLQNFGFPVATTIMAAITFILAIITLVFFVIKARNQPDYEVVSDSGISASWYSNSSSSSADELNFEHQPLLSDRDDHKTYTIEKVMYYEESRRQDQEVISNLNTSVKQKSNRDTKVRWNNTNLNLNTRFRILRAYQYKFSTYTIRIRLMSGIISQ